MRSGTRENGHTRRLIHGLDIRLDDLERSTRTCISIPNCPSRESHRGVAGRAPRPAGCEVTTGVGKTGVVRVLRNGVGPGVLLRADMDALPVKEIDRVTYRSRATGIDPDGVSRR